MRNWRYGLLILPLLAALAGCAGAPEKPATALAPAPPEYAPPPANLTAEQSYIKNLLVKNGYNGNGPKPTVIVVHKLSRKLTFYQGITPLKSYPIALGNDPVNDKLCQGDYALLKECIGCVPSIPTRDGTSSSGWTIPTPKTG